MQILHTNDRNLGLLVGRALDHQHFFYDVTYEHHLRDSQDEIYQFKHQPCHSVERDISITTKLDTGSSRAGATHRSGKNTKCISNPHINKSMFM